MSSRMIRRRSAADSTVRRRAMKVPIPRRVRTTPSRSSSLYAFATVFGFTMSTRDNSLTDGRHHVAAVASNGETDLYVDGMYAGTSSAVVTTDVSAIGNDYRGGNTFSPCIDDVRVYDRALTESEIADLAQ